MKKILFIIFLHLCCYQTTAQVNYVLNPSLEQHDTCPDNGDQIKFAKYWSGIDSNESWYNAYGTDGLPEYINTCSTDNVAGAPVNDRFYHYPRTGNGMAQVLMFYYKYPEGIDYIRDYLHGIFYKPLIANKSYCVTFYVAQEQQSSYSIKQIGAYLDNGYIDTVHFFQGMPQTQYTPQIQNTAGFVTDTLHWVKIQGSFTANGAEKFITIGNFLDNYHTDTATFNGNSLIGGEGYYLIDDISVIESDHVAFAGNDTTIHKGDSILLGEIAVPYEWYKLTGTGSSATLTMTDSTSGGIWIKPDSTTTYIVKQTLCGAVTWDTVVVSVDYVNVRNVENVKNVRVWPNPVGDVLHVNAAEDVYISIFSVEGKVLIRDCFVPRNDGTGLAVDKLASGVYFLELMDESGNKEVRKIIKE